MGTDQCEVLITSQHRFVLHVRQRVPVWMRSSPLGAHTQHEGVPKTGVCVPHAWRLCALMRVGDCSACGLVLWECCR